MIIATIESSKERNIAKPLIIIRGMAKPTSPFTRPANKVINIANIISKIPISKIKVCNVCMFLVPNYQIFNTLTHHKQFIALKPEVYSFKAT